MTCLVPKEFFITSGYATSDVSDLNAFDLALLNARICEQNLVAVSSVIPDGAVEVEIRPIPMGAVTFCVLSQMRGYSGENIVSGIAYAYRKDSHGGYVAEGHLNGNAADLKYELRRKMEEMARIRGIELGEIRFRVEELSVPHGKYGCSVCALVFCDFR